jgi:small nuclear ribonucleoprotein F
MPLPTANICAGKPRTSAATAKKGEMLTAHRVNEDVVVRLKWGATEYHGRLISVDAYMNLQLHGTEEYVNGKSTGTLGQVLIRCVLVLVFLFERKDARLTLNWVQV